MKRVWIMKLLWVLWLVLVVLLDKYQPFGAGRDVTIILGFIPVGALLAVWAEMIRRWILAEYPDVLRQHPEFNSWEASRLIWTIKPSEGDRRLRVQVRVLYFLYLPLSILWVALWAFLLV